MTSTKRESPYGSKTNFVLALPMDLPADEVVARAADAGLRIDRQYVNAIRVKARGPTQRLEPTGGVSETAVAEERPQVRAKRDYVLDFPAETPAREIIERAKHDGISLSRAYVYSLRPGSFKEGRAPGFTWHAELPPVARLDDLEERYVELLLEIGWARAEVLLMRLRSLATTKIA